MRMPDLALLRIRADLAARVRGRVARWWSSQSGPANRKPESAAQQCRFDKDGRSNKVIFVPHCLLNQNARDMGAADFPAMMKPILEALAAKDIGIIQLPCAELMVLGLERGRDVPPLKTIRARLELPESRAPLLHLVNQVVYQIKEYQVHGFEVVGILGKHGSPTCGVPSSRYENLFGSTEGVFMELLRQRLQAEGFDIGFKGIEDHRQQDAIEWVSQLAGD
jgi:predicted secreted protein